MEIWEMLVDQGRVVHTLTGNSSDYFHKTHGCANHDIVKYMEHTHSELNDNIYNDGWTALNSVAQAGNAEIFKRLVDQGLDVDIVGNDGSNVLDRACSCGNFDLVKYLLGTYSFLKGNVDNDGWTALHNTAKGGNVEVFQLLIDNGLGVNTLTRDGSNVLNIACRCGNYDLVKYLLGTYSFLKRHVDNNGWTALHNSAQGGNVEVFQLLIDNGLGVNTLTRDGSNVLNIACRCGNYDLVKYLLGTYSLLKDNVNNNGWTALHNSANGGNVEVFQLLTDNGLSVKTLTRDGSNVLCIACRCGNYDLVKYLLGTYSFLYDNVNNDGWTALHNTAKGGNVEVFQLLIDNGLSVNTLARDGSNVLCIACRCGNYDLVKYLLGTYSFLYDNVNNDGWTALHNTAKGGNVEVFQLLIDNGLSVNTLARDGSNVLNIACRCGNYDLVKYLLGTYSFLKDNVDNNGWTALHNSAQGGNVEVFPLLIDNGLGVNTLTRDGSNVLNIACSCGNYDLVKYLLGTYSLLKDNVNNKGWTALHNSAKGGNVEVFQLLIDNGLSVNTLTRDGSNVLCIACRSGNYDLVKYLLGTYSLLKDNVDNNGWTALHNSAQGGNVEVFQLLTDNGLSVKTLTRDGSNVLCIACRCGNYDLVKYLLGTYSLLKDNVNNKGWTALHNSAKGGNVEVFQLLIDNGLSVNTLTRDGSNVLNIACRCGNYDLVKYLLGTYSLLKDNVDNDGWTALHNSAQGGNVEVFQLLTDNGLGVNTLTRDGSNVLNIACRCGNYDLVKYLLGTYSLLKDNVNNNGWTALHNSAQGGNVEVFQLLTDNGLSVNTLTRDGSNVLFIACRCGNYDLVKYLLGTYSFLKRHVDNNGWTALHKSAKGGNVKVFQLLIDNGLGVNTLTRDGSNVLNIACRCGNYDLVKYLLGTYSFLKRHVDNNGWTALHNSAQGGNVEVFQLLIDNGLGVNTLTRDGSNVLNIACRCGNYDLVKYLLGTYSLLKDNVNNNGWTALHNSAQGGNVEVFQLLTDNGLSVNTLTRDGSNVLCIACRCGNYDLVKYLLGTYSFLYDNVNNDGWTALHNTAKGGNVEVFQLLIDNGLSVNTLTRDGSNVLNIACRCGNYDLVKYLLGTYSFLKDNVDNNGWTALHNSAQGGNVEVFPLLIDNGLGVNTLARDGSNVLNIACRCGNYDLVKYLLGTYSLLKDNVDNKGWTALHNSAKGGNVEVFQLLIDNGLSVNTLTRDGSNVLCIACRSGNYDLVKYLLGTYSLLKDNVDNNGWTALHNSAQGGNVEVFQLLTDNGLSVKTLTRDGSNVLCIACRCGNYDLVKYLLGTYSLLKDNVNNKGWTALHNSAKGGNVEVFQLLIDNGLSVNTLTRDGSNVLCIACRSGNYDLVKYLLGTYSFLKDNVNNKGWTALHNSAKGGNVEVFQLLIDNGLSVNTVTIDGSNVLNIAYRCRNDDLVKYIIRTYFQFKDINKCGRTALQNVSRDGNNQMNKLLADGGFDNYSRTCVDDHIIDVDCESHRHNFVKYLSTPCRIVQNKGEIDRDSSETNYTETTVVLTKETDDGANMRTRRHNISPNETTESKQGTHGRQTNADDQHLPRLQSSEINKEKCTSDVSSFFDDVMWTELSPKDKPTTYNAIPQSQEAYTSKKNAASNEAELNLQPENESDEEIEFISAEESAKRMTILAQEAEKNLSTKPKQKYNDKWPVKVPGRLGLVGSKRDNDYEVKKEEVLRRIGPPEYLSSTAVSQYLKRIRGKDSVPKDVVPPKRRKTKNSLFTLLTEGETTHLADDLQTIIEEESMFTDLCKDVKKTDDVGTAVRKIQQSLDAIDPTMCNADLRTHSFAIQAIRTILKQIVSKIEPSGAII